MDKDKQKKIITEARRGSQRASSQLYEETKHYAYRVARQYLTENDIPDALQEAYISVFQTLDTFDCERDFLPWLHTIVRNKCLSLLQKQSRMGTTAEDELAELADGELLPAEILEHEQKCRDILTLIAGLPEGQRVAISLFYLEEMGIAEMAVQMGVTEGTVKTQLFRGRQAVKKAALREEERGNKLYTVLPVPVLTVILRGELQNNSVAMPAELSARIWGSVLHAGITAAAQTAPVGVSAAWAELSAAAKAALAVLAAVALLGGATLFHLNAQEKREEAKQTAAQEQEEQNRQEEAANPALPPLALPDLLPPAETHLTVDVVKDLVFEDVGYFNEGVCPVRVNGQWGLVDKNLNFLVEPTWDYMDLEARDDCILVGNGENAQWPKDEISETWFYGRMLTPPSEAGLIDISGKVLVEPMPVGIEIPEDEGAGSIAWDFSVMTAGNAGSGVMWCETDGERLYYDKDGLTEEPPEPEPETAVGGSNFERRKLPVQNLDKAQYTVLGEEIVGIGYRDGRPLLPEQFTGIYYLGDDFFILNMGRVAVQFVHQMGTFSIFNAADGTIIPLEDPAKPEWAYAITQLRCEDGLFAYPLEDVGIVFLGVVEREKGQTLFREHYFPSASFQPEKGWKEIYKKHMKEFTAEYGDPMTGGSPTYYTLVDVDVDGSPELLGMATALGGVSDQLLSAYTITDGWVRLLQMDQKHNTAVQEAAVYYDRQEDKKVLIGAVPSRFATRMEEYDVETGFMATTLFTMESYMPPVNMYEATEEEIEAAETEGAAKEQANQDWIKNVFEPRYQRLSVGTAVPPPSIQLEFSEGTGSMLLTEDQALEDFLNAWKPAA